MIHCNKSFVNVFFLSFSLITDLIPEMPTEGQTGRQCAEHGLAGQRNDPCPGRTV